jgi:hypothetical protein
MVWMVRDIGSTTDDGDKRIKPGVLKMLYLDDPDDPGLFADNLGKVL